MDNQIENEILKAMHSGRIFHVQFTKKDGSVRDMKARMGVKKYKKSSEPSTTAHLPQYLTVFDVEKMNYRNVNVEKIQKFKCGQTEV